MAATCVAVTGAINGLIPNFSESRTNTGTGGIASGGGALIPNGKLGFNALTDGTSKTLAVSEQSDFIVSADGSRKPWRAGYELGWMGGCGDSRLLPDYKVGNDNRTLNQTTIRYGVNRKTGWGNGNGDCLGTGVCKDSGNNIPLNSAHPGGVNGAYCDGSVRFITDTVSMTALAQAATRDDGQPIQEP